jgi:hypothetical protein
VRALNHAKSFIFIFSLAESLGRFAVVHIPHLRIRVALTDEVLELKAHFNNYKNSTYYEIAHPRDFIVIDKIESSKPSNTVPTFITPLCVSLTN